VTRFSYGLFFLIVNGYQPVYSFDLMPEIPALTFNSSDIEGRCLMPSKAEEYLQQAKECEEKAQAADKQDISNCFRKLAEYWRALAKIAANKSEAGTDQVVLGSEPPARRAR
jgi:hypothetical protein